MIKHIFISCNMVFTKSIIKHKIIKYIPKELNIITKIKEENEIKIFSNKRQNNFKTVV